MLMAHNAAYHNWQANRWASIRAQSNGDMQCLAYGISGSADL